MKKILLSAIAIATLSSMSALHAQTVKGAVEFDGVNDMIVIPHKSAYNLGTGAVTMELWIQADETQAYNPHILHKKDTNTNATGFAVALNNSGKIFIELAGNGYSTGFGPGSGSGLDDGACHHIAFHRDVSGASDTIRIFVDGKLVKKSVKAIPSHDISYDADLIVGWVRGGFGKEDLPYKGLVKELRIWNTARTAQQIDDNMDKFLKGAQPGLVGYWRMNDNSGTTVKDYSSTKNNGTFKSGNQSPSFKDFCDVMNDVLPNPTGLAENASTKISVFPVPARETLNFNLGDQKEISAVTVINTMGAVVLTDYSGAGKINVSDLGSGVYFYQLTLTDNEVLQGRFIKE